MSQFTLSDIQNSDDERKITIKTWQGSCFVFYAKNEIFDRIYKELLDGPIKIQTQSFGAVIKNMTFVEVITVER